MFLNLVFSNLIFIKLVASISIVPFKFFPKISVLITFLSKKILKNWSSYLLLNKLNSVILALISFRLEEPFDEDGIEIKSSKFILSKSKYI